MPAAPDWGYWTEHKLEMLSEYLPAFTTASQGVGTTIYLDLFAGAAQNTSRTTGEAIEGSPRIALATQPPFTKVVLFELPARAAALEVDLRQAFPGRDLTVWPGDCNHTIIPALAALSAISYAPTFALIDQYAAEVRWSTLRQLANFRTNSKYKTELWLLFAHSMLPRGLSSVTPEAVSAFSERIDAMYGSHDWEPIYRANLRGGLTASGFRRESTNLMRWRLETELGYGHTHAFEMKNTHGGPLYSMIFATDNAAGDRIMSHIYGKAARQRPLMQAEAAARLRAKRDEEKGMPGLFDPIPRVRPEELYIHEPPTPPYGMVDPS